MAKTSLKIAVCLLLFVSSAFADDGFDCLRRLKGGTVKWDLDWQRDRTDQDVRYRITGITESQPQRNLHEVALELQAEGPASLPKRVSRIHMDHAAEMFCERAEPATPKEGSPRVHTMMPEIQDATDVTPFTPKELPFRQYADGQWRPAREPAGETLRVCATSSAVFSCTEADHARQSPGNAYANLAGRGRLSQPFIRFREGGWVRASEADMPHLGNTTTCSAFGRKFGCVEDEKNSYGALLKQLEARSESQS